MEQYSSMNEENSCSLQFTGGRDSTLTAIHLIEKYQMKTLHLLTFQTDLMTDIDKVYKNVEKLEEYFRKKARINHHLLDTNQLLRDLVQKIISMILSNSKHIMRQHFVHHVDYLITQTRLYFARSMELVTQRMV
jgi:hypothetical protein